MLALNSPELMCARSQLCRKCYGGDGLEQRCVRMVSLANRCDIPVSGAQHPLFQKLTTAEFLAWQEWISQHRIASEQV